MVQKEALKGASESLFSLLESQRQELGDWEADLSHREELLQKAGNGARPGDIVYLNVGGRTGIAVQRSTLTSIKKSLLGAKFSKNWEDGLDRDKDGNIFVDQDPDLFLVLINYLRNLKNTSWWSVLEEEERRKLVKMIGLYSVSSTVLYIHRASCSY